MLKNVDRINDEQAELSLFTEESFQMPVCTSKFIYFILNLLSKNGGWQNYQMRKRLR